MNLIEYPDAEMMMMRLADVLASELKQALLTQDLASLAVPGGTTPGPIFDTLCAVDLDWSRVDVLLTDERWVPESSDRSNTALLRRRLLVNRAAAAQLRDDCGAIRVIAVVADADAGLFLEVDAFDLLQNAVHEMLA